jgi:hypothetical protein
MSRQSYTNMGPISPIRLEVINRDPRPQPRVRENKVSPAGTYEYEGEGPVRIDSDEVKEYLEDNVVDKPWYQMTIV